MLTVAQVVVSVILIVLVLLQERSSGLSGLFGGDGGASYQTRRGVEKIIFWGTIISASIFAVLAVVNLIV